MSSFPSLVDLSDVDLDLACMFLGSIEMSVQLLCGMHHVLWSFCLILVNISLIKILLKGVNHCFLNTHGTRPNEFIMMG